MLQAHSHVLTLGLNYTVDAASGNDAEKDPNASGAFDEGDTYVYGSLDFPTKAGDFSLFAGSYMFDNEQQDFSANGGAIRMVILIMSTTAPAGARVISRLRSTRTTSTINSVINGIIS